MRYPEVIQAPPVLDLGPEWLERGIIAHQPPRIAGRYRVLAPKCDADGIDQGCLLPPEVAAPAPSAADILDEIESLIGQSSMQTVAES